MIVIVSLKLKLSFTEMKHSYFGGLLKMCLFCNGTHTYKHADTHSCFIDIIEEI